MASIHGRIYEGMIQNTSISEAPWFVVPADHKWFTRLVVASGVVDPPREPDRIDPKVDDERRKDLAEVRKLLKHEKDRVSS
jgi:hypothetical protein